ncbi:MAG: hydrogen gas-evolving membrane-bound hydrogenase subunit E [Verrucomicrobiota bacterium]
MLLISTLLILLLAVPLATVSGRIPKALRSWVLALPALAAFVIILGPLGSQVLSGNQPSVSLEWVPQLDLQLALALNGVGWMLALLVTGIGALIMAYASGYMDKYPHAHRLYAYLYLFMLAMVGLAFADHLLIFFIFWELTSISSYLLIGFNHENESARRNALQALLVTGMGGMALLAGLILLSNVTETWLLSEIYSSGIDVTASGAYPAIFTLIALGAFTKSAQFPFHFWLPNAMSAPTPVSAYLHSATMVKAGIFLLAIMFPILGGTVAWTYTLSIAGSITLLLGGYFGLKQNDLKKILAGTTLSVLGLLTLLLGIGSEKALLAAIVFLIGHALYKATLFMVAGSIDHSTGTRESSILFGLKKAMPWSAAAATLAVASKMGLPPFLGFIGKEYTYKASIYGDDAWIVTSVLILGNAILIALAIKAGFIPFWKKKGDPSQFKTPHEVSWSMRIGPLLLASLSLVFGLAPATLSPLANAAVATMLQQGSNTPLHLWAGLNLPLLLSVITLALGIFLAITNHSIARMLNKITIKSGDQVYQMLLDNVLRFARWQTRLLQSGYLRNYLLIIIITAAVLITFKLWRYPSFELGDNVESFSWPVLLTSIAMFVGIALAAVSKNRLTALLSLSVVGFGVAFIFAAYSAPDLAITQVLVETLTMTLFAWVIYKLPQFRQFSSNRIIAFDAVLSALVGVLVTLLILKSKALQFAPSISETIAAWSYPEAHGSNVVNVILVDFRALDTLGEIIVLTIAAVGVWALVKNTSKATSKTDS